jgi:REP element-mobilizing transposase RayT
MVNCNKCFKQYNQVVSEECNFCRDYVFHENILCDLLRSEQDSDREVKCFAFRPNLSVIGETKQNQDVDKDCNIDTKLSNRQKWLKAYSLQQLKFDPDLIFSNLNYHVCLVTNKRERLLKQVMDKLVEISAMYCDAGDQFNGKVSFLCAGFDHIHLHIESPPDHSADEVVNKIIAFSESAMKNQFSEFFIGKTIFQETYFIESIG